MANKYDVLGITETILRERRPAAHHIDSFNQFLNHGISSIITQGFVISDRNMQYKKDNVVIGDIVWSMNFSNVKITSPMTTDPTIAGLVAKIGLEKFGTLGPASPILPALARQYGLTYACNIYVDVIVKISLFSNGSVPETVTSTIKDLHIGAIPCMVGSRYCYLADKPREAKILMQEDPNDIQGYFILNGGEWSVDTVESSPFNQPRITVYDNKKHEKARVQIISKPGDYFNNSYEFMIILKDNGSIMINMQYMATQKIVVPFYVFFRVLGPMTDREIAEYIIGNLDMQDKVTDVLKKMVSIAFQAKETGTKMNNLNSETVTLESLRYSDGSQIARYLEIVIKDLNANAAALKDEQVTRKAQEILMDMLDGHVLPHIGTSPNDRNKKQKYVGYLIQRLLLTVLGAVTPLDRDSLLTKRMHAAGISVSKAFKTAFNQVVAKSLADDIINTISATSRFDKLVDNIASIRLRNIDDLETKLVRAIKSVQNTSVGAGVKVMQIKGRITSQNRYLRNDYNAISIAGTISVANAQSNKQNERADLLRRVHSSWFGYIDPCQTPDTGEKVGMKKQMAITAIISNATSSAALAGILLAKKKDHEKYIIPWDQIRYTGNHSRVFCNGDLIGETQYDSELVALCRQERREKESIIHKHTSIYWDLTSREIYFWTDFGRLLRPLIIVYNNLKEFNDRCKEAKEKGTKVPDISEFKQWTLVPQVLGRLRAGKITVSELVAEGVIEYLAADESENMFICPNISDLMDHKNDIRRQWTHCDIEPHIFGFISLSSPLINHSYAYRVTLYTNHRKQACTWYSLAFPWRSDKLTMFQFYNEQSLVSTFSDQFANPSGHNCTIAIMLYTGFNQQDSLIVNADTIERGFFNGTFFDNISSILDKNETFELSPKIYGKEITDNIVGGVPKNGTILHRNSVLIAKTYREGNSKLIDRSILYKNRTDGIVVNSIRGRDEKKADVLRLKFRQFKNLIVGDKLSSRTGNKGIVARLMRGTDMPYAEDGTIPDIIVNAQSIPTRRALNQLIESLFGCYAARLGTRIDATSFLPVDIEYIQNRLKDLGYDSPGYKQMYNGMTGEWINTPIFIGPTTYLRLQKFADNESHASQKGPTQATTHQPVHGRNEGGSFKISEMEVWCMATHGTARAMGTKLFTDSDGTTMYICAKCGTRAICNKETNLYRCKKCEELATIVQVPTCWTSNMYQHYIRALGIETKFDIEPLQFKTKY